MRSGLPWRSLVMVSVSETLPRFSWLPTAVRAGFSRRSKPCGTRQRISRLRPLTLRASQTQRRRSSAPCARAYPVMLAIKNPLQIHSTGRAAARHSSIGPRRIQRAPPEGYPMKNFLEHRHHRRLERHRRGAGARLCRARRGARADRPRCRRACEAVAAACRAKGATVVAGHDRRGRPRDASPPGSPPSTTPIRSTSLIANAGISIDKDNSSLDDFSIIRKTLRRQCRRRAQHRRAAARSRLIARRRGQIAVVSSLASFIGLPYSASYNASKAAVRVWGESIRYVLKKNGIGVSVDLPRLRGQPHDRQRALPHALPDDRRRAPPRSSAAASRATRRASPFPIGTKAAVWLGQVLPGRWTARLLGA